MVDYSAMFQILLAIPPAIRSAQQLVQQLASPAAEQSDVGQITKQLQLIQRSLRQFAEDGSAWFTEAKEYHERLTAMDIALEELSHDVEAPRALGGFRSDRFDVERARRNWLKVRNTMLNRVLGFLENSKSFEEDVLLVEDTEVISGSPYAQNFIAIKQRIDHAFDGYDPNKAKSILAICIESEKLIQHTKNQIISADDRIIERASSLASTLSILRMQLGGE